MPANPTLERRDLAFILGQANPTALFVRVAVTGSIVLSADDVTGMPVHVTLSPLQVDGSQLSYDLLQLAPIAGWRASATLRQAVDKGWLFVDLAQELPVQTAPVAQETECCGIAAPANPNTGDLLMYDGDQWARLAPGPLGTVLQSAGSSTVLGWGTVAGTSAGTITGQTTSSLATGDAAYVATGNSWSKARSDGSSLQATVRGMFVGTAGSVSLPGNAIGAASFTTAGGAPTNGAVIFLAAASDDSGTGAGKLTATAPTSGYLVPVGVCVDSSAYAGAKTAKIIFSPEDPILL